MISAALAVPSKSAVDDDDPTTATTTTPLPPHVDSLSRQLRDEALQVMDQEPQLRCLLQRTVLAPGVVTLEDAVAATVAYRLTRSNTDTEVYCPNSLRETLNQTFASQPQPGDVDYDADSSPLLELGHSMAQAVRHDVVETMRRDPAAETLLEVILFYKGFAALVAHRAARILWKQQRRWTALWLQSQASAVFGVDIHPQAQIGAGILLDHGTGIVIGETATVGDGCTILHGVTLGGTGKDTGDRHPKVGADVLIGAGASLLGNIKVGNASKIGAGSVVLRPIPAGATAVGAPAKIIGKTLEKKPAQVMDERLQSVGYLHKSSSSSTVATAASSTTNNVSDQQHSPTPNKTTTFQRMDSSQSSSSGSNGSCLCPFREYIDLAQSAPPNTLTLCKLYELLQPLLPHHHHHPDDAFVDVGEAFINDLDTRNVGYVRLKYDDIEATADLLLKHIMLDREDVVNVLVDFVCVSPKQRKKTLEPPAAAASGNDFPTTPKSLSFEDTRRQQPSIFLSAEPVIVEDETHA